MSAWAERAKVHFLQTGQEPTPKTPETPLLGVLGAPSQHLCEKTEGAKGTFVGFVSSHLGHSEKTALPAASPNWAPPAQPDPGLPRLLGAAMALCDRTNATDKTRQDWRADVEAALPEHRGDLLALVQALMPKAKPPTVVAAAPNPAPTQTWRQHDKADQLHYWSCPQCLAVVKTGTGKRCTTGQQLHDAYIEAATREGRFIGATPDPAKPLPPFHAAQPWRAADKQWLAHWQQCPQCQTAGRTNTARCTQGEDLFAAYQQAIETGK